MHNSTQSSVTEESCQRYSTRTTVATSQAQRSKHKLMTRQHQQLSRMYSLTDMSYCPAFRQHHHTRLCVDSTTLSQLNLLLPPTWLTLTLCPTTQHRRLADWSRDRQAGAAHVTLSQMCSTIKIH